MSVTFLSEFPQTLDFSPLYCPAYICIGAAHTLNSKLFAGLIQKVHPWTDVLLKIFCYDLSLFPQHYPSFIRFSPGHYTNAYNYTRNVANVCVLFTYEWMLNIIFLFLFFFSFLHFCTCKYDGSKTCKYKLFVRMRVGITLNK